MKERYRFNTRIAFSKVFPNLYGRFSKEFMINEEEYDIKKEFSRKNDKKDFIIWRERFLKTLKIIQKNTDYSVANVAKAIGVTQQFLYKILKEADDTELF